MDIVLKILSQLGANQTAFIQFIVFAVSITALTVLVFNPFFKALDQRQAKTKGAEDIAKETVDEARMLDAVYKQKAREINDKIKTVFDGKKNEAQKIAEQNIATAKKESEVIIKDYRQKIETENQKARTQMASLTTEIANELTQKFESGL